MVPDDPGDGEVVHLVVHDDPRGGGHELAAPDQVNARRHCACGHFSKSRSIKITFKSITGTGEINSHLEVIDDLLGKRLEVLNHETSVSIFGQQRSDVI